MSELLEKARRLLDEGYTCALVSEEKTLTSKQRGVAPLLAWLDGGVCCKGLVAADKVVGKAAAYLYILLGVSKVHAKVLSKAAADVFKRFSLPYTYEESVAAIRNRTGDGFCPMESAVWNIDDPTVAYDVIVQTKRQLQEKKA